VINLKRAKAFGQWVDINQTGWRPAPICGILTAIDWKGLGKA
jgi:hypothetical protein